MAITNDPNRFGTVTRVLHWSMAALIIPQIPLGLYIADVKPSLATLWLYGLHKTLGIIALALILARILWHLYSPPPAPLGPPDALETRLARIGHKAIYALCVFIPLAGWVASSATGLDVIIFNRWTLPALAPVSETWEKTGFSIHAWSAKFLILALMAHLAGVARRVWLNDGTLSRMLTGHAPR